tara:strand:- start:335 stop:649 length:315 start_codon:yes stop_codon:yes gene_type:complete
MRSLKIWLPVVVVFLVSLVPVVAVGQYRIINAKKYDYTLSVGDVGQTDPVPFEITLGDSAVNLAVGIAAAGIAIGLGIIIGAALFLHAMDRRGPANKHRLAPPN